MSSLTPTPPVTTKAPLVELVDAVPDVTVVSPATPKVLLIETASSRVVVPPAESIVKFPEAVSISLSSVTPI